MNVDLNTAQTNSISLLQNVMSNNVLLTSKSNAYQKSTLDQLNALWDSQ
jgi:hypothetical protein